jgi:hypothetical protein
MVPAMPPLNRSSGRSEPQCTWPPRARSGSACRSATPSTIASISSSTTCETKNTRTVGATSSNAAMETTARRVVPLVCRRLARGWRCRPFSPARYTPRAITAGRARPMSARAPRTSPADSVEKRSQRVAMAGAPSAKRPPITIPTTQQAACSVAATSAVSVEPSGRAVRRATSRLSVAPRPRSSAAAAIITVVKRADQAVGFGAEQAQIERHGDEEDDEAQPGAAALAVMLRATPFTPPPFGRRPRGRR